MSPTATKGKLGRKGAVNRFELSKIRDKNVIGATLLVQAVPTVPRLGYQSVNFCADQRVFAPDSKHAPRKPILSLISEQIGKTDGIHKIAVAISG